MLFQTIHCPKCHDTDIIKLVLSQEGKQRYKCRETACDDRTFILDYAYPGQSRQVKQQIVDMALNGSGVRDTARVLNVSPSTVIQEFKKKEPQLQKINLSVLKQLNPEQVEVEIPLAEAIEKQDGSESELDEMWSYVGKKDTLRWLWYAIEQRAW